MNLIVNQLDSQIERLEAEIAAKQEMLRTLIRRRERYREETAVPKYEHKEKYPLI